MRRRALGAIVVFAKAPRPGEVKTRLVPPLSVDQAAGLYRCMLADVLQATSRMCVALDLEGIVALHPPGSQAEIEDLLPRGFRVVAQRGGDLAQRMAFFAAETASGGHSRILLRGSDSPLLAEEVIAEALSALDEHDLALCPDADGGYGLVALRPLPVDVFDHEMSTQSVLEATRARAKAAGLRSVLVRSGRDVDVAADLAFLFARRNDVSACRLAPRTFEYLERELRDELSRLATKSEIAAPSASSGERGGPDFGP